MSVNSVSVNNPPAVQNVNAQQGQSQTAEQPKAKPQLSTKGKLIIAGLAILGIYSAATLVNYAIKKSASLKGCEEIEKGIGEIIAGVKKELSEISTTVADTQTKIDAQGITDDCYFILKDDNLTRYDSTQAIVEGSTLVKLVKGKISAILTGCTHKEGGIDVYKNALFFNGNNETEFARNCLCKGNSLLRADEFYFLTNGEVTKAASGFIDGGEVSKNYASVIELGENNIIKEIMHGVTYAGDQTSCHALFRKNDAGKWKKL